MKTARDRIFDFIKSKDSASAAEVAKKFKITRQAVNRHLWLLIREGRLLRQGTGRRNTIYLPNEKKILKKFIGASQEFGRRYKAAGLSEDSAFTEIRSQPGLLDSLNENGLEVLQYAFTEMLNNAIEHSGSRFIDVELCVNEASLAADVVDKGIGAFENIRKKKNLPKILDAIQDLLKGKLTTAPEFHSGEGIFFTSKIVDRFVLSCNGKVLIIDNKLGDIFVESGRKMKGTSVHFEIVLPARIKPVEVFRKYTNENFAFDRSSLNVKLFDTGDSYVSRSQAKRLLHSMENFKSIELDFTGVKTVGQAFADEVFRVFKNLHPEINITYKIANEDVEFMIARAVACTDRPLE
jgi:anti-sigma regulatory factor (Ser/Thr protein kinase)